MLAKATLARQRAYALQRITQRLLPVTLESGGTHDAWPIMGWAMLARASGTLDSIMALLARRRATDAGALNRVLFEHIVTLAWVAIDADEHPREWMRWDRRQRLKVDNDLREQGAEALLDPTTRAQFEAQVAEGPLMPDNVAVRAQEADAHWSVVTHVIQARPTDARSFRQMYRAVFRYDSRYVHATVGSIEPFVSHQAALSRSSVLTSEITGDAVTSPFTRAVAVYALGLLLAESIFGLPPLEPLIDDIFGS
jgi:hypothetical protein